MGFASTYCVLNNLRLGHHRSLENMSSALRKLKLVTLDMVQVQDWVSSTRAQAWPLVGPQSVPAVFPHPVLKNWGRCLLWHPLHVLQNTSCCSSHQTLVPAGFTVLLGKGSAAIHGSEPQVTLFPQRTLSPLCTPLRSVSWLSVTITETQGKVARQQERVSECHFLLSGGWVWKENS